MKQQLQPAKYPSAKRDEGDEGYDLKLREASHLLMVIFLILMNHQMMEVLLVMNVKYLNYCRDLMMENHCYSTFLMHADFLIFLAASIWPCQIQ